MKVTLDQLTRDFLAYRGESPDLLPVLEPGEKSAVLTLARALEAHLPQAALEATLATPRLWLDDLRTVEGRATETGPNCGMLRVGSDYLRLYSLQMADWREPLTEPEPEGSLRRALGANAPDWMVCRERPMAVECRDTEGIYLKVYGSDAFDRPATLLYVARPDFDGTTLTLSAAAYPSLLRLLSTRGAAISEGRF